MTDSGSPTANPAPATPTGPGPTPDVDALRRHAPAATSTAGILAAVPLLAMQAASVDISAGPFTAVVLMMPAGLLCLVALATALSLLTSRRSAFDLQLGPSLAVSTVLLLLIVPINLSIAFGQRHPAPWVSWPGALAAGVFLFAAFRCWQRHRQNVAEHLPTANRPTANPVEVSSDGRLLLTTGFIVMVLSIVTFMITGLLLAAPLLIAGSRRQRAARRAARPDPLPPMRAPVHGLIYAAGFGLCLLPGVPVINASAPSYERSNVAPQDAPIEIPATATDVEVRRGGRGCWHLTFAAPPADAIRWAENHLLARGGTSQPLQRVTYNDALDLHGLSHFQDFAAADLDVSSDSLKRPVLLKTTDTGDGLLHLAVDPETGRCSYYGRPR